jgi:hypothetical protein
MSETKIDFFFQPRYVLATSKNLYAIIIYTPFFRELGEFGEFSSVPPRKPFLGFSQAGLVSTKKVRGFSVFFLG